MAGPSWTHSGAAVANSGIAQVLDWYSTRGGNMLGARRWETSPLVLTHVRWLGPRGESLEAQREPQDEARLSQPEREVWVELAVVFSSQHPAVTNGGSPWLPLSISQPQAMDLASRLGPSGSSMPNARDSGGPISFGSKRPSDPSSAPPHLPIGFHDAPTQTSLPPLPRGGFDASAYQTFSDFDRTGDNGATVLACIEVELPMSALGPAGQAASADFARDVALNFSRAANALPQVREVRGWMRSGRLVLATRMVMASDPRAPSRAETENALAVLRDALMACTIPYNKLMLADPGEWMQQGQVLAL